MNEWYDGDNEDHCVVVVVVVAVSVDSGGVGSDDDHGSGCGGGCSAIVSNGSNYKGPLLLTLNHCTHLTLWLTP